MDGAERCSTKHFVRVIRDEMIANRIHVAAEGSGESSFFKDRSVLGQKPIGKGGHARDACQVQDPDLRNLYHGAHSLLR